MKTVKDMERHWKTHQDKVGAKGIKEDPHALLNVCIPSESMAVNRYHEKIQEIVFDKLMEFVPQNNWAYDIGCGGGRWVQRLALKYGICTIGIDLQKTLIERNQKYADVYRPSWLATEYVHGSFMEYQPRVNINLITSITVLQHMPSPYQLEALIKLYSILENGGYLLFLENTSFKSDTVFPSSFYMWCELARMAGFKLVKRIPYDHSPFLRLAHYAPFWKPFFKRVGVWMDLPIERILIGLRIKTGSRHGGFLFRKDKKLVPWFVEVGGRNQK